MKLIVFVLVLLAAGCAHERKKDCTWICEDDLIPHSCYCIEDLEEEDGTVR